jgi:hypothetical protein
MNAIVRIALFLVIAVINSLAPPCACGQPTSAQDSIATIGLSGSPVVFAGDTLFLIYGWLGPLGAKERAFY